MDQYPTPSMVTLLAPYTSSILKLLERQVLRDFLNGKHKKLERKPRITFCEEEW